MCSRRWEWKGSLGSGGHCTKITISKERHLSWNPKGTALCPEAQKEMEEECRWCFPGNCVWRRARFSCWPNSVSLSLGIKSEIVRIKYLLGSMDWFTSWFINTGLQAAEKSLEIFFSIYIKLPKLRVFGTSLVVQWLRLCASPPGGAGLIPGQGTKVPHATVRPINK